MTTLRLILGDQLSNSISSLRGSDHSRDIIFMCEVWDEATHVKHHKKKIAFLFSAMRHFSEELRREKYEVEYTQIDDQDNAGSFRGEIERMLKKTRHCAYRCYPSRGIPRSKRNTAMAI